MGVARLRLAGSLLGKPAVAHRGFTADEPQGHRFVHYRPASIALGQSCSVAPRPCPARGKGEEWFRGYRPAVAGPRHCFAPLGL